MKRKIRKLRNELMISGCAVVAFGLWSFVKFVFCIFLKPEYLEQMTEWDGIEDPGGSGKMIIYLFIIIILIIDMIFRVYIARRALMEARGKAAGSFYPAAAAAMALYSAYSIFSLLFPEEPSLSIMDTVVPAIVEMTSMFAMCELSVSAIRLRRILKKEGGMRNAA